MNNASTVATPSRSNFVSVIAWIFICLSGLLLLISLLQNVMVALVFPLDEMQHHMHDPHGPPVPPIALFMFSHLQLFLGIMLVLTALLFASSIGLLRRKNWARQLFIVFMALGIVYNLVGLVFQFAFFNEMPPMPPNAKAPPEFAEGFKTMMMVMQAVGVIMALGFSALFGWIIKRLVSDKVKEEFGVLPEY